MSRAILYRPLCALMARTVTTFPSSLSMLNFSHRAIFFLPRIAQGGIEMKISNWSTFIYQQLMHATCKLITFKTKSDVNYDARCVKSQNS